jgi:phosphopantothenoylcysteine decarboxylase/phosphopantothenate--cysteine ligase
MNVNMWQHPATGANVALLRARGVHFIGPESGELACGWEGQGRMAEPAAIAAAVDLVLAPKSLANEIVLVTAGGTREAVDAVRDLGNRSSGKMGFALAAEAARRGAEVLLVAAPSSLPTPAGVRRIDVESALEMRDAVLAALPRATVVVKAAAVADFRPATRASGKLRKEDLPADAGLTLELVRNPDILAEVCRQKGPRIVVGFAAESGDLLAAARRKLARKGCDLLVANDVSSAGSGFDGDENAVVFVWPEGEVEELPRLSKALVAAHVLDRVEKLRGGSR